MSFYNILRLNAIIVELVLFRRQLNVYKIDYVGFLIHVHQTPVVFLTVTILTEMKRSCI